ncbi:DUF2213 domain-containing protein [Profundibacterium mesophilum]|uniref:Aldose 1-epimerase n=1 Tax=Profundibacterium mesophilum KAUST100406-0324 TaxID=1037889 RepID=A0A921NNL9_9RHOB|nr:DUF2213 domain-containing protein [Profundibacterium mesophilum]KAF0675081.1 aldose 1-epimerase [Profundibacterium mesophilum KAUST100406-0324]
MRIQDTATITGFRRTRDGYLEGNARVVRTGIQQYAGVELDRPDLPIINVYRDASVVFAHRVLDSFSKLPITMDHPGDLVDSTNWRDLAIGTTGDEVLREGEYLKIGLKITDEDAIAAIIDGKRELSAGYLAKIEMRDGIAPDGTPYQAVQTDILANHLAVVDRGRAGPLARIGDDAGGARWGATPIVTDRKDSTMADAVKTRSVLIDGLSVETTEQGAQALEKLTNDNKAKDKALADAQTAHDAEIVARDKEIATRDAEIERLTKAQLDGAALDAMVQARGDLIAKARTIAKDADFAGKSDADIRKATVAAALGDTVIDGRSDAYIEARFDVLAEDAAKGDPIAQALSKPIQTADAGDYGQGAYEARLSDAWKNKGAN